MVVSDNLFQLIKSLDKNEKGYFKKFSTLHVRGEQNNYIKLFDAIDNQKTYDETKIIESLKKEKFISHISVVKNYLYNLILRSLEAYHTSIEKELNNYIHQIRILSDKGLFKQCETILKRAKKTAVEYESHIHLIQFGKLESELMHQTSFQQKEKADIIYLFNDIFSAIDKYKNLLSLEQFVSEIFIQVHKKGADMREKERLENIKSMFDQPILKSEKNALSFEAKARFYKCHILYSFMSGNYKNALIHTKDLIRLMEAAPHQIKEHPSHYLAALQNLIVTQFALKQYDESLINLKKLRGISVKSDRTNNRVFYSTVNQELQIYISTGQFEKGVDLIESLSKKEKNNTTEVTILSKDSRIYFYYTCAYIYFGAGQYSMCIKYLDKVLNVEDINTRGDLYCFAKILNLIVHFELGNSDLLEYIIKSTQRFLIKRKHLYQFETIFLKFIKKELFRNAQKKEMSEGFKNLKQELDMLMKNPREANILNYFDFISWARSKYENRSFAEIVKEKVKRLT